MIGETFDERLGLVGSVTQVGTSILHVILDHDLIPVVAPVAFENTGEHVSDSGLLNLNADTAAAHIAIGLKASRLVFLTDVPGILDAKGNLASANAYLKSCGTINKKAHIMQIVVTDEIPKNSPPLIRPIGWSKEFMYKYKPDTSAPENYNTESHACIYDVSGQAVAYTSKHQTFLDKLNEFLSTQKNP